jgi:hypothetical protein
MKETQEVQYVRIPDHTPILDTNLVETLVDGTKFLDAFVQGRLSPVSFFLG